MQNRSFRSVDIVDVPWPCARWSVVGGRWSVPLPFTEVHLFLVLVCTFALVNTIPYTTDCDQRVKKVRGHFWSCDAPRLTTTAPERTTTQKAVPRKAYDA